MACPLFEPTDPHPNEGPADRPRPPLGRLWAGRCRAVEPAVAAPDGVVQSRCNLGYARGECDLLPREAADAVRFSVVEAHSSYVQIRWLVERDCLPERSGTARYEIAKRRWEGLEDDELLERQAGFYLRAFLESC